MNPQQQKVVRLKQDLVTVHAQWVAVRNYSWIPPNPPVRQTRLRMLQNHANETWITMVKKAGGAVHRRCADEPQ